MMAHESECGARRPPSCVSRLARPLTGPRPNRPAGRLEADTAEPVAFRRIRYENGPAVPDTLLGSSSLFGLIQGRCGTAGPTRQKVRKHSRATEEHLDLVTN